MKLLMYYLNQYLYLIFKHPINIYIYIDSLETTLPRRRYQCGDQQVEQDVEQDQHGDGPDSGQDELRDQKAVSNAENKRHGHSLHNHVPISHIVCARTAGHIHMKENKERWERNERCRNKLLM